MFPSDVPHQTFTTLFHPSLEVTGPGLLPLKFKIRNKLSSIKANYSTYSYM